ncbi:MAG TPA: hypothetical protein VHT91_38660 [Kofleriaceae bacterium]|nr:hypothetical protein [Kofleriaceae bacterium]
MTDGRDRRAVFEAFEAAVRTGGFAPCDELCFRVLWELPVERQIESGRCMLWRYLPIFEHKWPSDTAARRLLSDVGRWLALEGPVGLGAHDRLDPADVEFVYGVDALIGAAASPTSAPTVTSGCVGAMVGAITARARNVWVADDPDGHDAYRRNMAAAEAESTAAPEPDETVEPVGSRAVEDREWRALLDMWRGDAIWQFPEVVDGEALARALAAWQEREQLWLPPRPA